MIRAHVLCCGGTGCTSSGSQKIQDAFVREIEKQGLAEEVSKQGLSESVTVTQTGCIGLCQYEPIVEVYQQGKEKVTYVKMTAEKAAKVIEEHIKGGKVVEEYTYAKNV